MDSAHITLVQWSVSIGVYQVFFSMTKLTSKKQNTKEKKINLRPMEKTNVMRQTIVFTKLGTKDMMCSSFVHSRHKNCQ